MTPRRRRAAVAFVGLVEATGVVVAGAALLGFLAPVAWFFELLAHWRFSQALLLAAVCATLLVLRRWRSAAAFAVFFGVVVHQLVPLHTAPIRTGPFEAAPAGARPVRALLANVRTDNRRTDLVVRALREVDPDVVVLQETSERWLRELADALEGHPHRIAEPRGDNFGIAVFSRLPLERARVAWFGSAGVPTIVAEVGAEGGAFTLVATHPIPPVGALRRAWRDEQLREIAAEIATERGPVVLLGDLNTTRFTPGFREFVRVSGLRDAAEGRGHVATWPARFGPLGIAIDHALVSKSVRVTRFERGPRTGSDHGSVVVEFVVLGRGP